MKKLGWMGMAVMAVALLGVALLSGCSTVPKGASKQVTVGTTTVQAAGAGIVKVEGGRVTYQIKCGRCGFVGSQAVIDLPSRDKPFEVEWVCPNCGHKQKVTLTAIVAAAGG